MITAHATEADITAMYGQMRDEGLLERVLHNDMSFEAFQEIAGAELFFVEKEDGEVFGFWWLTSFYATALCFHGCAFRARRKMALERMQDAFKRLAAQGVTDLYAFSQSLDVAMFLRRLGFEPVSEINKEITVWAVSI